MVQAMQSVVGSTPAGQGAFHEHAAHPMGGALRMEAVTDAVPPSIRAARTEADRQRASELVARMYGWRGYRADGEAKLGNGLTLVAADGAKVVATIAVRLDDLDGLAADAVYRTELDMVRASGARLCEFTRLAVDRTLGSKELLARLFHAAMIFGRGLNGCSDVVIEVNPRHVPFYQRMFDFVVLGPQRHDPRVNAPAVPMRLDLAHAERQVARSRTVDGKQDLQRTLYPLFFSAGDEAEVAARLARCR